MKRQRNSQGRFLTGGSGDVKPQILTLKSALNAAGDYIVTSFPLPVARIGASKDKASVIEILRVDWYSGIEDIDEPTVIFVSYLSTSPNVSTGTTLSAATIAADAADAHTIALSVHQSYIATAGAAGEAIGNRGWPMRIDLTDGAGNGVLVATDTISIVGGNHNGTAACTFVAKVLYRIVNVGITEYVGIVTSQQ